LYFEYFLPSNKITEQESNTNMTVLLNVVNINTTTTNNNDNNNNSNNSTNNNSLIPGAGDKSETGGVEYMAEAIKIPMKQLVFCSYHFNFNKNIT